MSTELTDADRCDRCGSRAYVRAVFGNGHLMFCSHHGRQYEVQLRAASILYTDETETLRVAAELAPTAARAEEDPLAF